MLASVLEPESRLAVQIAETRAGRTLRLVDALGYRLLRISDRIDLAERQKQNVWLERLGQNYTITEAVRCLCRDYVRKKRDVAALIRLQASVQQQRSLGVHPREMSEEELAPAEDEEVDDVDLGDIDTDDEEHFAEDVFMFVQIEGELRRLHLREILRFDESENPAPFDSSSHVFHELTSKECLAHRDHYPCNRWS